VNLYCAVDVQDGRAVRLVRGDFDERRDFGDPLALVRRYASQGARWLHVVDLDAARTGQARNRDVVLEIAREARELEMQVQCSGGVRSRDDAAQLIAGGAHRVVVGTAAQKDPALLRELCDTFPSRVGVGVDHRARGAQVALSGWTESSGVSVEEALARLEDLPVAAVVVTCIERDGTLEGPDLEGLRRVLGATPHAVIASGGVRSTQDLASLRELSAAGRRLEGAIVGMALVQGLLEVREAISACEASG